MMESNENNLSEIEKINKEIENLIKSKNNIFQNELQKSQQIQSELLQEAELLEKENVTILKDIEMYRILIQELKEKSALAFIKEFINQESGSLTQLLKNELGIENQPTLLKDFNNEGNDKKFNNQNNDNSCNGIDMNSDFVDLDDEINIKMF
jgi:hypothetical protein